MTVLSPLCFRTSHQDTWIMWILSAFKATPARVKTSPQQHQHGIASIISQMVRLLPPAHSP